MPANCILRALKVNEILCRAVIIASVSVPTHTRNQNTSRDCELVSSFVMCYLNRYGLYFIITLFFWRQGIGSDRLNSEGPILFLFITLTLAFFVF